MRNDKIQLFQTISFNEYQVPTDLLQTRPDWLLSSRDDCFVQWDGRDDLCNPSVGPQDKTSVKRSYARAVNE